MALQRSDTTVVVADTVTADYDDIIAFNVDLVNKSISITIGSGNMVEGEFVSQTRKDFIIQDKPERSAYLEETLEITDNKITLTNDPRDEQIVCFAEDTLAHTITDKEVTFTNEEQMSGLTEIKVGYAYIISADPVFSLMAAQLADGDKSIYLNLKQLLWAKLIELGHVSGTIV